MKYFTYKITNKATNKSYYGWTNKNPISRRLVVHFHSAKTGNKNGCFPVRITYDNGDVKILPSQTAALEFLNIKSRTTLRSIATGLRYKNGKYEKYNSPYDFTIELLRHKV